MNLENKRILVTGGARRVGKMFVEKLQSFGADVVVHYNTSKNEAEDLSKFVIQCDLSKPDSFPNLINECGPIDILINNASIFSKDKLIESDPAKVFKEFAVNFFSPFELTRQFAKQNRDGIVLNILDRRILANEITCLPYCLSKKSLAEFTYAAALELAPRIRVNAIAPGPILAPDNQDFTTYKEKAGFIPLEKIPNPMDVINAALYLINNESITGQVIYVDGGQNLIGNIGNHG
ncbi:MAG: SDR family oxidoreductase [Verrucomicrobiota bacterium]|nr:SDR family oxidoreductase [Verrucomicrobiota bacterium]MEC8517241.1 SDR family oxidoreductase [Verrucomicrobiota bacterium]MEC8753857.1 SDR family oxidoreductase [Verrucomicrobiota bacterium]